MATRQVTQERKNELTAHLRIFCERESLRGGPIPSMRELAEQFGVSLAVTQSVIKSLQTEGLVSSVRGSGTKVSKRKFSKDEAFIYIEPPVPPNSRPQGPDRSITALTSRLAELGAFCVCMPNYSALAQLAQNHGMRIKGLFGSSIDAKTGSRLFPVVPFPTVALYEYADPKHDDGIKWDDFEGGQIATEHLLALGHRNIVFVGNPNLNFPWLRDRAKGYVAAMRNSEWAQYTQTIISDDEPLDRKIEELPSGGTWAARYLAGITMPDAVVACNDEVAIALLSELHHLGVPLARWPAIIGFDGTGRLSGQPISSMRLDSVLIGRTAADQLWKRAHGEVVGEPQILSLPMTLVPTLTSQAGWAYRLHRLVKGFPFSV